MPISHAKPAEKTLFDAHICLKIYKELEKRQSSLFRRRCFVPIFVVTEVYTNSKTLAHSWSYDLGTHFDINISTADPDHATIEYSMNMKIYEVNVSQNLRSITRKQFQFQIQSILSCSKYHILVVESMLLNRYLYFAAGIISACIRIRQRMHAYLIFMSKYPQSPIPNESSFWSKVSSWKCLAPRLVTWSWETELKFRYWKYS